MLDLLKSDGFKIRNSRNFRFAFPLSAALGAFVVALLHSGATEAEVVAGRGAGEMLAEVLVTGIHMAVAAVLALTAPLRGAISDRFSENFSLSDH